ncbi:hypothetical protein L6452_38738 [Arctium lappa]|uniref:Uncharacterized protein n=1 Tax=Arctium lappa TaxID=4217 RepID=A0ACB8XQU9_ARCLA|nr:hypothetical protein L6452_38738 [Arctium lappa]
MAITKSKPRKRPHAEMKGDESSSENSPNKQPSPSKKIAKEKQPPMKRLTRSSSRFKTKLMTEDEGSAIALSEDSRGKEQMKSILRLSYPNFQPLLWMHLLQSPEQKSRRRRPLITLRASVDKAFAAMDELLDDTPSELLGINLTPKNQEQPSVNPTPPVQHQLIDEPSEETLEPSPIASQHTEPLATPVNNPSENMALDRPIDEAPP